MKGNDRSTREKRQVTNSEMKAKSEKKKMERKWKEIRRKIKGSKKGNEKK